MLHTLRKIHLYNLPRNGAAKNRWNAYNARSCRIGHSLSPLAGGETADTGDIFLRSVSLVKLEPERGAVDRSRRMYLSCALN